MPARIIRDPPKSVLNLGISPKKINPMTLAHSKAVYLNEETNVTSPYLMAETEAV